MDNDIITAELARIEDEAAHKTKMLLGNQDAYLRMHALIALLVAHGAPQEMRGHVSYSHSASMIIYATTQRDNPEAVLNAVQDTRLPYRIAEGYSDDVRSVIVEGYEGVNIALPAALFPNLQAVA